MCYAYAMDREEDVEEEALVRERICLTNVYVRDIYVQDAKSIVHEDARYIVV